EPDRGPVVFRGEPLGSLSERSPADLAPLRRRHGDVWRLVAECAAVDSAAAHYGSIVRQILGRGDLRHSGRDDLHQVRVPVERLLLGPPVRILARPQSPRSSRHSTATRADAIAGSRICDGFADRCIRPARTPALRWRDILFGAARLCNWPLLPAEAARRQDRIRNRYHPAYVG